MEKGTETVVIRLPAPACLAALDALGNPPTKPMVAVVTDGAELRYADREGAAKAASVLVKKGYPFSLAFE